MTTPLTAQRLIALFVFSALLLNFPLLGLWDIDATVGGLPFFPVALFGLWAAQILALAWFMERLDVVETEN